MRCYNAIMHGSRVVCVMWVCSILRMTGMMQWTVHVSRVMQGTTHWVVERTAHRVSNHRAEGVAGVIERTVRVGMRRQDNAMREVESGGRGKRNGAWMPMG